MPVKQITPFMQNISDVFSEIPPFSMRSNLFENQEGIKNIISSYIKDKLEQAKKEGYKEAITKIQGEIKKKIDDYMGCLTEITDVVSKMTTKEFQSQELKITAIRTNFYFNTQQINILFIIDGDIESEIRFCSILNKVEKFILENKNLIAELFYINNRDREIDKDSIKWDYPFVRRIES